MDHAVAVEQHLRSIRLDILISDDTPDLGAMNGEPFLLELVPLSLGNGYEGFRVERHQGRDRRGLIAKYFVRRQEAPSRGSSHA